MAELSLRKIPKYRKKILTNPETHARLIFMRIENYILRPALLALLLTGLLAKVAFGMALPVSEFTLENGMNVIVIEDHRAPVVLHAVQYNVGGADEQPGKTGLAHFFEHLMFKGTTRYPKDSFDQLLDENGAERNAFTTLETTFYYERAAALLLEKLMDLDADRMQNLVLTPEVFETERKVVQEERRLRTDSDPYGTAFEKMNAAQFKAHPYGRPVVGWPDDVANLNLADATAFYRAHYQPANAILLVVGDVTPTEVKRLAQMYYGPLKNTGTPQNTPRPPEPPKAKAERLELEDARVSDPALIRTYNMGLNANTTPREAAAMTVLASIMGSNSQSRLIKDLVTRDQVATTVSVSYRGSTDEFGQMTVFASPRTTVDVLALEQRIDAMLQDVKDKGVTTAELQDAITTEAAMDIYSRDNAVGLGVMAASVRASGRDLKYIDEVSAALTQLTPADIQAAAQKAFSANNSVTLILRPKR
jgi:zinc protease